MKTDIMDAFNTVIDNFKRVELGTNSRIYEAETFVREQKMMNKFLKPFLSAEQTFSCIRKLPLCGSKSSTFDYEWPTPTELRMLTLEDLAASQIS